MTDNTSRQNSVNHRRRKVLSTGVRVKVQKIGGQGEGRQLFTGCKLIKAPLLNQCQLITFLTLKTDSKAKFRIELKSILLEIP